MSFFTSFCDLPQKEQLRFPFWWSSRLRSTCHVPSLGFGAEDAAGDPKPQMFTERFGAEEAASFSFAPNVYRAVGARSPKSIPSSQCSEAAQGAGRRPDRPERAPVRPRKSGRILVGWASRSKARTRRA